jgi:N-acetylglucosamine-6-phosphate deacetylase
MKIIDIHTHGIGGYDTKTTNEEHILKIAEIHGSSGVSEIIPTIYPDTIKVMRKDMTSVKKAMEKQKDLSNPPLPPFSKGGRGGINCSSRIIGVHLEGPFLNPEKCGALNAMTFIEPTEYNLKELIEGFEDMVKIMTIAPEIDGAKRLIRKISEMGIIVSMGHSDASYAEAEAGFHEGAKGITHLFNAMRGFHHRESGIVGFGLLNQDIYVEVIADPYHLHPATLELIFKVKNPDRIIIVSDSVKETKAPSPSSSPPSLEGGGWGMVEAVSDIHGKLLGGCMTIVESSKRLTEMGFDESVIMKCVTENPERYLQVSP